MSEIEPMCGICNKTTTTFSRNHEYYHACGNCKDQFSKLDQTLFKQCSCCKDVRPKEQMEKYKTCLSCRNSYKKYYKDNTERENTRTRLQSKEITQCEICNTTFTKGNLSRHKKTQKHQENLIKSNQSEG